ncbi:MAG: hypothetical protein CVV64_14340 [Candidatus Wallbacteria bacterium HGW-Wallbacteria-1]|jgi:N-dimethylarginine dimethylaminohydrolase|uniref:Agmatine deiminase n=1 Tax=Candidatus Wallbacteria bacterium HGW-Wallbacteria-1 TaxID=2013854 RepID=A0A2N1PM99_9BACT|nr:MAG: hypothetical protein CVV64_14340 [Candidatus Wallbacteria bacterium HGW-Wallbacteria-1]
MGLFRSFAIAVLIAVQVSFFLCPVVLSQNPSELMVDNDGAIERVVIQYSTTFEKEILPTFMTFLKELHSDISVTLVCETSQDADFMNSMIKIWGIIRPDRIDVRVFGKPITVWARDRFALRAFRDNDSVDAIILPILSEDEDQDRVNDMEVPGFIMAGKGVVTRSVTPGFFFEGGDMVSTSRRIFVGRNTLNRFSGDEKELMSIMRREFGRDVIMLGGRGSEELVCHIDLIFSSLDENRVVLGDPMLTRRLLNESFSGDVVDSMAIRETLDIMKVSGIRPEGSLQDAQIAYGVIRRQLDDLGYKVTALPVIHCVDEDEEDYIITYCNVLLDYRDDGNYVYMPVYGLDRLDDYAESVFENLGFHVKRVDISRLYQLGGTVRCVTNVMGRRLRRIQPATGRAIPVLPEVKSGGQSSVNGRGADASLGYRENCGIGRG